jgi:hypothetical protein
MDRRDCTLGEYLLIRLKQLGVDHLFGVPGHFVLGFLNPVLRSDVRYTGTCNGFYAAYTADGYARLRGIGAFTTTERPADRGEVTRPIRGCLSRRFATGDAVSETGRMDARLTHPLAASQAGDAVRAELPIQIFTVRRHRTALYRGVRP